MLANAIAYAAEAHRLQKDKRGEPYILHPMRVVLALKAAQWSETYQVAAALHDTVEDTDTTLEDIHERFGPCIGEAVDALTRRRTETYKDYIIRCCENKIAGVVKRYDVYDNFDPSRYCEGIPVKRYAWALEYLNNGKR